MKLYTDLSSLLSMHTLLKMGRYYNTTVSLLGHVSKIVSILSVN